MLPKVLFIRTCKAWKDLFLQMNYIYPIVTNISQTATRVSRMNLAPSGSPIISWWLVVSIYWLLSTNFEPDFIIDFLLYIVVNFQSCLKCLWTCVHGFFFPSFFSISLCSYVYGTHIHQPGLSKELQDYFPFPSLTGLSRHFLQKYEGFRDRCVMELDNKVGDLGLFLCLLPAECLILGNSFSL